MHVRPELKSAKTSKLALWTQVSYPASDLLSKTL